nr:hypothetical protein [uncultured Noviherbaspirillum sp.]
MYAGGVSTAVVALQYRLSANLLPRWVTKHKAQEVDDAAVAGKVMPIQPDGHISLPFEARRDSSQHP